MSQSLNTSTTKMNPNLLYAMYALFHTLCAIAILPYVALAMFFVFVGRIAESKGIMELVENVYEDFLLIFGKVIYVAPVLWICLVAMGFLPSLQRSGSICICLLAVVSLTVMFAMHSAPLEFGHYLFLLPCLGVVIANAVLIFRGSVGM